MEIKKIRNRVKKIGLAMLFPLFGFLSLVWVIIRVGTKPSRLRYPCMKVAIPTAGTFMVYLASLFASIFSIKKAKEKLRNSKYLVGWVLIFLGIISGTVAVLHTNKSAFAQGPSYEVSQLEPPNQPMGEAKGIFPGRVVWVFDRNATNENCNPGATGDGWFLPKNNNQDVIDAMLDTAVKVLVGENNVKDAWDKIFRYNNSQRGKGEVGYQEGEIIFIKINRTSSYQIGPNFEPIGSSYGVSETSPQLVLSLLRHLVYEVGVPQQYIYIGDPMKHLYNHDYDLWHSEFPNIHYLDHDRNYGGREVVQKGSSIIHYSDSGAVLREGSFQNADSGGPIYIDTFYTIFENCDYLINVPTLKGHRRAGVTLFAKNHFGSHVRSNAVHLHMGLVAPDEPGKHPENERHEYGLYRVLVDLMGYELFREKNLIFLMDALWSAGHELDKPTKWKIQPFNNDWSSSIFISQDNVAIESVGYDFLRAEYTQANHPGLTYVQMEGVDDYLHQAADSANWPDSLIYDPEGDGTPMPWSLGVHEHWNNATNKQYSRNLGTGNGIELVQILGVTQGVEEEKILAGRPILYQNYPNPFNSSTTIRYEIPKTSRVQLSIYNLLGEEVATLIKEKEKTAGSHFCSWDGIQNNGKEAPSGFYIYKLKVMRDGESFEESKKMLLIK